MIFQWYVTGVGFTRASYGTVFRLLPRQPDHDVIQWSLKCTTMCLREVFVYTLSDVCCVLLIMFDVSFDFPMGPFMMDFGFESLWQQFLDSVLNLGSVPLVQEVSPTR